MSPRRARTTGPDPRDSTSPRTTGPPEPATRSNAADEWLAHLTREVAAISEGFCPQCSGRLQPIPDAEGMTGDCPTCGTWRAWTERERREQGHDSWTAWTARP